MANDDIRDLIARYATASLTVAEQKRLFAAALEDQELFDELAREQDLKLLLDEPGARDRLIRALAPPKRKVPWILALAPVGILSALLILFFMRPAPKPQQQQQKQVAAVQAPTPPAETAATGNAAPDIQPTSAPAAAKTKAIEEPVQVPEKKAEDQKETVKTEAVPKEVAKNQASAPAPVRAASADSVVVDAQAAQVQQPQYQQQAAPSGPGQKPSPAARSALPSAGAAGGMMTVPPFGFHYSVVIPDHLSIIPAADGYLSVKSADGAVLFAQKRIAAGIINDIALPTGVRSVSIVFSLNASPPPITPAVRTAPEGTEQGTAAIALDLKLNP